MTVLSTRCPHWQQRILLLCMISVLSLISYSQVEVDSVINKLDPQSWAASIEKKVAKLEAKIIERSHKALNRLQRQEEKIYRKMLSTKDSLKAKAALTDVKDKYKGLKDKLSSPAFGKGGQYIAKLDTLKTALKFLDHHGASGKVKDAFAQTGSLQERFGRTEEIQRFIKERKTQLKQQLEQLGLVKELKRFNKELYYYAAQIKEYKELLKDSKKAERKALELLSKTKFFKDFMRKNGQLASLFRIPGDPNDPNTQASLAGLQTRSQVTNLIQQQLAIGGPNARAQFQQNLQQAQSQLNALKNKVLKAGGNSSDSDIPDFKPNGQKTKPFLRRLEYGTNIQTQKATTFFPVTTDIGLSVGYKLNDKSVIGIGASYKMGLGRGWNRIRFSNEGIGLRSFIDVKIKGSFYVSGGYEQNYKSAFNSFFQLQDKSSCQQSALVGISKVISIRTKFFKKTKLQLLVDLLSHQQVPKTQPILFRVGYNF